MATSTFDISSITGSLIQQSLDAAKLLGIAALKESVTDITAFVASALPALGRYSSLLLDKQITEDEFTSLVAGIKDEAIISSLTVAGLDAVQVDLTKSTILKTLTSVLIGAVSKIA